MEIFKAMVPVKHPADHNPFDGIADGNEVGYILCWRIRRPLILFAFCNDP